MLSADDQARMRSALEKALPQTGQIRRTVLSSDNAGDASGTASLSTTVACRIDPTEYEFHEALFQQRQAAVSSWIITFPALTDVTERDQIVVGTRLFEVSQLFAPRSYELTRRVLAIEIL